MIPIGGIMLRLAFSIIVGNARAQELPDCSDRLLAQADEAFPDNSCHLRIREPGGYAIFCDQIKDEVLTDLEVPIFVGLDKGRFNEVPYAVRQRIWGDMIVNFMRLSSDDLIEIVSTPEECVGSSIHWWVVPTHPPLKDWTRKGDSGQSRDL